ncbi:MAG: dTDP-4-dehydrorhamnose reductase [candidate division WOR-3 bacterium]
MKKVFLTGASGQLGREIIEILKEKYIVIAPKREEFDLEKFEKINNYLKDINPDIIILSGAYTDVDKAEEEKEKVYRINFLSVKEFVKYTKEKDKNLIFISTDYVFDGKKEIYKEEDNPNPLNFYGKTKFLAEREIISNLKKYFIVRTSWLYGEGKKNFVYKFIQKCKEEKILKVVNDRYGSPTYTKDLAQGIEKLINSSNYGIYHIVNTGRVSRYDFAMEIVKILNLDVEIVPVSSDYFKEKAIRPFSSALDNKKFCSLFYELRDWKEALKDFLKNRWKFL